MANEVTIIEFLQTQNGMLDDNVVVSNDKFPSGHAAKETSTNGNKKDKSGVNRLRRRYDKVVKSKGPGLDGSNAWETEDEES